MTKGERFGRLKIHRRKGVGSEPEPERDPEEPERERFWREKVFLKKVKKGVDKGKGFGYNGQAALSSGEP